MCFMLKQSSSAVVRIAEYEIESPDINLLSIVVIKGPGGGGSVSSFSDKRSYLGALTAGIRLLELSMVLKQLHQQAADTDRRMLKDIQADILPDGCEETRQRQRKQKRQQI